MAVNRNLIRNSQPEETLSVVKHRPFALPKRPWTMMQRWNDLLFAHWPIPAAKLEPLLPAGLQVDTFDQSGWLGVVPFWMDRVQLRGMPRIPGASRFPELNLRTYVRERNTTVPGSISFALRRPIRWQSLWPRQFSICPTIGPACRSRCAANANLPTRASVL